MALTALSTVKYDVLNFWNQRFDDTLRKFNMPLTTDGSGSDATLVDSSLGLGNMGLNDFDRRVIENITNSTVSGVDKDGFAESTGTLTMSPAVTVHASGNTYIIYPYNLHPAVVEEAIDKVLLSTYAPHLYFPSLHPDADLTGGTITDAWELVSTSAIAYTTTAADVLYGPQAIAVTSPDSIGGGVQTASAVAITVTEGEQLLISVPVRVITSGMTVSLYDVTNDAVIESASGIDELAWTEARFTATIPDNCESIIVRMLNDATDSVFFVGAPVVVQSRSGRWYTAPDWLDTETQIVSAHYIPAGLASEDSDSFIAQSSRLQRAPMPQGIQDAQGIREFYLAGVGQRDLYALKVYRPFTALSGNTSTTRCNRQYLMWKVLANLCFAQDEPGYRDFEKNAQRIARRLHYGDKGMRLVENPKVLV